MNPVDLPEALLPYLRTWKKHQIYFGIETGRRWLKQSATLFPAACSTLGGEWQPGEEGLPMLSVKIRSESLAYRFPHNHPMPSKRGVLNPAFLDPATLLSEHTFPALQNVGVRPVHVIVSIDKIGGTEDFTAAGLCRKLGAFLNALPESYSYAVRLANPEYYVPAYFDCLAAKNVSHVITDGGEVFSLLDQMQSPHIFTGESLIVMTGASNRAEWQLGIVETVRRCLREKRKLYCYLADTGEKSMLRSLYAVMELMDADLAKLSYIKREQAA